MARCKLNAYDYIQTCFLPQVAVLCSEDADIICLKNNLRFVELLQPFCKIKSEVRMSDINGSTVFIPNLRLAFEDMNRRPPQPILGKKLLNDVVSNAQSDQSREINISSAGITMSLDLQTSTPWYEMWRDTFLYIQYSSDHEFTKHFVACIIVVSAASENALEQLHCLSQFQHQHQHQLPSRYPKWFSPNILKFYVLLHDNATCDSVKSELLFEQLTSMYGAVNCSFLCINSCEPGQPSDLPTENLWGEYLRLQRLNAELSSECISEASSGTITPRDDVTALPTRVTEGGDTVDDAGVIHPLSPTPSFGNLVLMEEKNGGVPDPIPGLEISPDVPILSHTPNPMRGGGGDSVPLGSCLTVRDLNALQRFVDDFCTRSLIPHVERQTRFLNDAVTNRSRSKTLLNATRRWLGGGGGGGSKSPSSNNSVVYTSEAMELQTRRLGDICFMFGLYETAYNAYVNAKNDFRSDQAWLYFAGAQEMAALAAFMQRNSTLGDFPKRYLEGSLQTYLNVCKVYNFAIRTTLLSTEVLKRMGDYSEAAMMFIKLTNEESDLLSALMLEQAAHCFLNAKKPLLRKYAFHMTLAGHRFSKSGQRLHALRAYRQAFQVYNGHGWSLAEDHIHFTVCKQALHTKQLNIALESCIRLVDQKCKAHLSIPQSANQQLTYMREYINTYLAFMKQEWQPGTELPVLPVPFVEAEDTRVLLGQMSGPPDGVDMMPASHVNLDDDSSFDEVWMALERELLTAVAAATGSRSGVVHPHLQLLTKNTSNSHGPWVPVHECVVIEISLINPLGVSLLITDISLVYTFEPTDSNLPGPGVKEETLSGFNMPGYGRERARICLYPLREGRLSIRGIRYKLSLTPDVISGSTKMEIADTYPSASQATVEGCQLIDIRGQRLNKTSTDKVGVVYGSDHRLNIEVVSQMPRLGVRLLGIPAVMQCGELRCVRLTLTNEGPMPMANLFLAVSDPSHIYLEVECEENKVGDFMSQSKHWYNLLSAPDAKLLGRAERVKLPKGVLMPGQSFIGQLWLHAPAVSDKFDVEMLFYYECQNAVEKNRYRLLRHRSIINAETSLGLTVSSAVAQSAGLFSLYDTTEEKASLTANLVVQVNNMSQINSGNTFSIIGLVGNSKQWIIVPHVDIQAHNLRFGESCRVCVRCLQLRKPNETGLVLSKVFFLGSEEAAPSVACCRFSLRERPQLPLLLDPPPPPGPSHEPTPPQPTQAESDTREFEATKELDLMITMIWKASINGHETQWGSHNVKLPFLWDTASLPLQFGSGQVEERPPVRIIPEHVIPSMEILSIPSIEANLKDLVKVSGNFPSAVTHDFFRCRLCCILFKVRVQNCCGAELTAVLDTDVENCSNSNQLFTPEACGIVRYVGGTRHLLTLAPWQCKSLPVKALVTTPGTYNLGLGSIGCRRSQSRSEEDWIEQTSPLQTAVIVSQKELSGIS